MLRTRNIRSIFTFIGKGLLRVGALRRGDRQLPLVFRFPPGGAQRSDDLVHMFLMLVEAGQRKIRAEFRPCRYHFLYNFKCPFSVAKGLMRSRLIHQ